MKSQIYKIAIISSQAFSLVNFRGALIGDLAAAGIRVFALAPDYTNELREMVRGLGAEPVDYSLDRTGLNPLRDFADTLRLARILHRLRPDVALGYFIKPVVFGTIAAWLAGVPKRVAMIEGLGYAFMSGDAASGFKRRMLRKLVANLYRFSLARASRVILLNHDDIRDLCAAGVLQRSKVILIPGIGVDLQRFRFAPPVISPVTFILVARLLREKGVYDFVEAARMIRAVSRDTRFVLVGDTDSNPGSVDDDEIAAWREEGVVECIGWAADVRVPLAAASVFVLPSYREGLPRSTQEAMAMGRAVITTDAPGCRDTVENGVNGFLIPVRQPAALAEAMQRYIAAPSLIASMGSESRRLAEERYDVRMINKQMLSALVMA